MAGKIKGKVVSASASGDLVTDLTADQLRQIPAGASVVITCDGHQTQGILPLEHSEPEMTFVAVIGPTSQLELRLVGDSAYAFLGIRPGSDVAVKWQ